MTAPPVRMVVLGGGGVFSIINGLSTPSLKGPAVITINNQTKKDSTQ